MVCRITHFFIGWSNYALKFLFVFLLIIIGSFVSVILFSYQEDLILISPSSLFTQVNRAFAIWLLIFPYSDKIYSTSNSVIPMLNLWSIFQFLSFWNSRVHIYFIRSWIVCSSRKDLNQPQKINLEHLLILLHVAYRSLFSLVHTRAYPEWKRLKQTSIGQRLEQFWPDANRLVWVTLFSFIRTQTYLLFFFII